MIPERLARLRREMEKRNISVYIVPTADFHESEYVGEHFKARRFITGFTGSAGTAVITLTEAGLWTDGRYFLQAAQQLEGTGVTLFRMGEEGVPTMPEYVRSALPEGGTLGFDGRVINAALGRQRLHGDRRHADGPSQNSPASFSRTPTSSRRRAAESRFQAANPSCSPPSLRNSRAEKTRRKSSPTFAL